MDWFGHIEALLGRPVADFLMQNWILLPTAGVLVIWWLFGHRDNEALGILLTGDDADEDEQRDRHAGED